MKPRTTLKLKKRKPGRMRPLKVEKLRSGSRSFRSKRQPKVLLPAKAVNGKAHPTVKPHPIAHEIDHARTSADSQQASTLQLYLREIGQVKLLTPKEEI